MNFIERSHHMKDQWSKPKPNSLYGFNALRTKTEILEFE